MEIAPRKTDWDIRPILPNTTITMWSMALERWAHLVLAHPVILQMVTTLLHMDMAAVT